MTVVSIPEEVLDAASRAPHGVRVTFTTKTARNAYRMRLQRALRRAREHVAPEPSPWDDLVFRSSGECDLEIAKPEAGAFGIKSVEEF